jgi:hypothetical protein
MHRMRLADMPRRPFGHAIGADLAGLDRPRERADRIGDRYLGVETVHVVEIDVVGLEQAQALVDRFGDRRGRAVDPALGPVDHDAALRGEEELLAPPFKRRGDQRLVPAAAIDPRGVEVVVAEVERAVEQPRPILGARRRAVSH